MKHYLSIIFVFIFGVIAYSTFCRAQSNPSLSDPSKNKYNRIRLQPKGLRHMASFGKFVCVSNDGKTIAVSSPGRFSQAVYIYTRNKNKFENIRLSPKRRGRYSLFGYSIGMSGDGKTLVVGDPSAALTGRQVETARFKKKFNELTGTYSGKLNLGGNGGIYIYNGSFEHPSQVITSPIRSNFGCRVAITNSDSMIAVTSRTMNGVIITLFKKHNNIYKIYKTFVIDQKHVGPYSSLKIAWDGNAVFSDDGKTLAIPVYACDKKKKSHSYVIVLKQLRRGRWKIISVKYEGRAMCTYIAFSSNGKIGFFGSMRKTDVFKYASGKYKPVQQIDAKVQLGLTLSGDNNYLLSSAMLNRHQFYSIDKYQLNGGLWKKTERLLSSGKETSLFGKSVAISKDDTTIVVGARFEGISKRQKYGAVYVYYK